MKLVVVSDLHGDWVTLGVRRHDEVQKAFWQAVECALDERAVFLCLGDIADPDTGGDTFRTIEMCIRGAMQLQRNGLRSIWIAGNHDVWEDGTGATSLSPIAGLDEAEFGLITVAEEPKVAWLHEPSVAVLCLPFVPVSHAVDMAEAARTLWPRTLLGSAAPDAPKVIVASHLMVPGVVPGEETKDMSRGRDVLYPFQETRLAELRLNGHYHKRQSFDPGDGGPPIVIPGSLARLHFPGDHDPAFLVVDVEAP